MRSRLLPTKIVQKEKAQKTEAASNRVPMAQGQERQEQSVREILSLQEAITSLERTPRLPSVQRLTCILHKCRKEKNLACAQHVHAYICKCGLEAHASLGNYLVPMWVEVGSMCDAQQVFNRLINRNEYSWTSLIIGYIECGESQHALDLYQKMREDCVHPSGHTFVALLKACARLQDAERGRETHAEIATTGLERDLFIGNSLVTMYAKCGLLVEAQEVFDKLPVRDAVSWNALIAAYAEHGLGEQALNCFKQMLLEHILPNAVTLVVSLKACGSTGAIDKGQEIHVEIARQGLLERDLTVGNALVDMYAKCGLLAKARRVFDELRYQNVVSWNALITGYTMHGFGDEALKCFEQMKLEGVSMDALTTVSSLKACGIIGAIDRGCEIYAEIAEKGFERDPFVGNALLDMYAKCGLLAKAQDVFDKLQVRDVISWTALVAAYADHGHGHEALKCFEQMQMEGVSPNSVTFVCSLKACSSIGATDKGKEIHVEIARRGLLEREPCVGNALVDMYAKCGSVAKAQEVFDKLQVRDVVSWTALIAGYARHGLGEEALHCFEWMKLEGLFPDTLTFVFGLKVCGSIGAIDKGCQIHAEIERNGLLERDPCIGNALVDMYAKCGSLAKAQEVFDRLLIQDVVSWTALIAGYAYLGESEVVFHMLERMKSEGIKPNGVTFLSVFTVCSHTGLVDKGQKYFDVMTKDYSITPTIEHHTCMVDLLGRAGQLDEAIAMITKMPLHSDLVVWHAVLGACRKWGNVEFGRHAFEHAVKLEENDAAAYVSMLNIYVDAHMHQGEQ